MNASVGDQTVLKPAEHCVVRKQVDQVLLYNSATDELHLLSPSAFYVFALCDGVRTVADIVGDVAVQVEESQSVAQQRVAAFLASLVQRKLLAVCAP